MSTYYSLQTLNRTTKYHFVNVIREQGNMKVSIKNQLLVVYTPILIAFYQATTKTGMI